VLIVVKAMLPFWVTALKVKYIVQKSLIELAFVACSLVDNFWNSHIILGISKGSLIRTFIFGLMQGNSISRF
ncbi:MAG TPA: hypothetical protein PLC74_04150, partial [Acetobacteraceae bacterium]|nr:hypothetical protein [Acetobacteraceae bacterium]